MLRVSCNSSARFTSLYEKNYVSSGTSNILLLPNIPQHDKGVYLQSYLYSKKPKISYFNQNAKNTENILVNITRVNIVNFNRVKISISMNCTVRYLMIVCCILTLAIQWFFTQRNVTTTLWLRLKIENFLTPTAMQL